MAVMRGQGDDRIEKRGSISLCTAKRVGGHTYRIDWIAVPLKVPVSGLGDRLQEVNSTWTWNEPCAQCFCS
jgi:hypothetical protein